MTIEVTARYFAAFRERAGRDTERVSTQARTAADLYGSSRAGTDSPIR